MPADRDDPRSPFWAVLSAAAGGAAAALVLLSTPTAPDVGVPWPVGRDLALLLVPAAVYLAAGCWAQRGEDFGPSAPVRGDLARLVAAKRTGYPARPAPPPASTPPRPDTVSRPRTQPRVRAEMVDEGDAPSGVLDRLLWAKRRGYRG